MDDANARDIWRVATQDVATFDVPRFIRLFTINRIVTNYLQSKKNDSKGTDTSQADIDLLQVLVSELKDKKMHSIAYDILSRLVNNGLKVYMIKWYNEKEQAIVIELIFKQIILPKFGPEYQKLTTYYDKKYWYQCQVLNNDDLMREIFRYLTFKRGFIGELHDCSLVHSCWLYHIWSTKLIYGKYYLDEFLQATMKICSGSTSDNININNTVTRSWERLVNLKHVAFDTHKAYLFSRPNDLLISRLSMLRHIEKIECYCHTKDISIIKILMQQCKDKIEMFDVFVSIGFTSGKFPMLSPLELPNCKDIRTNNMYFYPMWTKVCKNLEIINQISKNWCTHVINKCDCSGIEQFSSKYFAIDTNISDDDSIVFKHFSQKFVNLKQLNIDVEQKMGGHNYYDKNISKVSLLELFCPIIIRNNGRIHLTIRSSAKHTIFEITNMIEQFVKKNGTNNNFIKHVSVDVPLDDEKNAAVSKKLIGLCCENLEWLEYSFFGKKVNSIKERRNFVEYIVACLKNMNNNKSSTTNINDDDKNSKVSESYRFDSIQVIDIKSMLKDDASLIVNEILGTQEMIDIFSKHGIFCNITQEYQTCDKNKKANMVQFKEICDKIILILRKQIAIDIRITFNNVETNNCKKIFESYFDNINYGNNQVTVLKQYKGAKCNDNKYCVGLKFPQVSISVTWKKNRVYCRFVNARYAQ